MHATYNSAKIKKMKKNKSPRVNGISPDMLNEINEEISIPMAIVFNLSIDTGVNFSTFYSGKLQMYQSSKNKFTDV